MSAPRDQSAQVWRRFCDDEAYKDLRERLAAKQGGLCGYCERRLTDQLGVLRPGFAQIEHVAPKSEGVGRTLDWNNLMLACLGGTHREKDLDYHSRKYDFTTKENVSCGQAKDAAELPTGCDPRDIPVSPLLLRVTLDGRVIVDPAACAVAGVNPADLEEVVNVTLNLNCETLKWARTETAKHVLEWLIPCFEETQRGSHLTAAEVSLVIELVLVAGRLRPDRYSQLHEFWTTERQFLPNAEGWLQRNASLFT